MIINALHDYNQKRFMDNWCPRDGITTNGAQFSLVAKPSKNGSPLLDKYCGIKRSAVKEFTESGGKDKFSGDIDRVIVDHTTKENTLRFLSELIIVRFLLSMGPNSEGAKAKVEIYFEKIAKLCGELGIDFNDALMYIKNGGIIKASLPEHLLINLIKYGKEIGLPFIVRDWGQRQSWTVPSNSDGDSSWIEELDEDVVPLDTNMFLNTEDINGESKNDDAKDKPSYMKLKIAKLKREGKTVKVRDGIVIYNSKSTPSEKINGAVRSDDNSKIFCRHIAPNGLVVRQEQAKQRDGNNQKKSGINDKNKVKHQLTQGDIRSSKFLMKSVAEKQNTFCRYDKSIKFKPSNFGTKLLEACQEFGYPAYTTLHTGNHVLELVARKFGDEVKITLRDPNANLSFPNKTILLNSTL